MRKSDNYDGLIGGNVGKKKLMSMGDKQQAEEWLTLEHNMTAYTSPNNFVQAFGKTNK